VLASVEMPKDLSTFGCRDGVWVTSRPCLVGLAVALRAGLLEVSATRLSLQGKNTKIELLYNYFVSPEFRQRVEGIVEAFMTMQGDLDSEKRSIHRLWAKRAKQLQRAVVNATTLYGNLGGILGAKLPQIANLELAAVVDGPSDDEQSWSELLLDLQHRGLTLAPELATGDGALGFWAALRKLYPETREQRCWVHKTANVLNKATNPTLRLTAAPVSVVGVHRLASRCGR
jgi:hypothetical protein